MKKVVGIMACIALVALMGFKYVTWKMDVSRGQINLLARYEAQHNVVETAVFQMRSTIKQIHKCNDEWADKFISVVAMQAKGRSGAVAGDASGVAGQNGVREWRLPEQGWFSM